MSNHLLEVNNLKTSFFIPAGEVKAVDDVSFTLDKGEVLGIVGESGSGKSVTAYSIMQILSKPGEIVGGSVKFDNQELVGMSEAQLRKIRGAKISIIFQDPMTSLNPVYTVGNQIDEAIKLHTNLKGDQVHKKTIEILTQVGVNDPEKRAKQYPFEFSGGMLQRVMIAMALVCEPDILIADEPTTALDVTIQAQIMELMRELQKKLGMSIILITHDLGVVADMCDKIQVMYAGKIVERGTAKEIFYNPKHEYTKGLLKSIPSTQNKKKLIPIQGNPIDLLNIPKGCAFSPRCEQCMKICLEQYPAVKVFSETQQASCWMNVFKELKGSGTVE
ncbi:MAG: ABC transporter ATP-binding protein [Erysipelotrichaceae bacterium]|nr:ABC transporter ATP-binding protein [Erysipelotrichaceae bacterium]